jgi:type II secretory pathway predicted ATPase ExeA
VNRRALRQSARGERNGSLVAIRAQVADDLLSGHPLIVVTGAPGTGKTVLCQLIGIDTAPRTFPFIVPTPPIDVDGVLADLVERIGVLPAGGQHRGLTRSTLLAVWQRFIDSLPPLGARAILIFDEAHRLDPLLIEQIYSLTTTASGRDALQVVFVGEPVLDDILRAANLPGPDGRIARRYQLTPVAKPKAIRWGYAVALTPPLVTIVLTAWWSIHHDVFSVVKPEIAFQDQKIETLSLEAVLRQAETARAQPDVRALTKLRNQVAARSTQSSDGDKQEIASTLRTLDRFLDDARRLQLEVDGRRLATREGLPAPTGGTRLSH